MADSTLSNLTSLTLPSQATDLLLVGRGTARPNKVAMSDALNSAALAATTAAYGVVLLAPNGGTTAGTVVQANDSRLTGGGGGGVTSLAGTANQISVSAATGAVTLSLPSTVTAPGTLSSNGNLTAGNGSSASEVRAVGDSTAAYGYTLYTGGTYEASLRHTATTGLLKLDVGRNSTWGGAFEIYADTTRAARFTKTTTTLDGITEIKSGNALRLYRPDNAGYVTIQLTASDLLSVNYALKLSDTTDSSSTITGALQVVGGAGIAKALTLGGRLNAFGSTAALTHQLYVYNQLASATNAALSGAQFLAAPGYSTFIGTTGDGTNASYQGSIIGNVVQNQTGYVISDAAYGLLLHGVNGGLKFAAGNPGTQYGSISNAGVWNISTTTNSSSAITGALVVAGGVGIGGALFSQQNSNAIVTGTNFANTNAGTAATLRHTLTAGTNTSTIEAYSNGHATFPGRLRFGTPNGQMDFVPSGVLGMSVSASEVNIPTSLTVATQVSLGNGPLQMSNGRQFQFQWNANTLTLRDNTAGNNPFTVNGPASVFTVGYTTDSTTKSDGALVVSGGVGVEKNIIAGSGIAARGTLTLPAAWTGSYGIGLEHNNATATSRIFFGDGTGYALKFASRSASATTDRMTLMDNGNLTVGGALTVSGTYTVDGLATSAFFGGTKRVAVGYDTANDYGWITAVDTGVSWKQLRLNPNGGRVVVPGTDASTDVTSGALVIGNGTNGGLGVSGAINTGGDIKVTRAAASNTGYSVVNTNSGGSPGLYLEGDAGEYAIIRRGGSTYPNPRTVEYVATGSGAKHLFNTTAQFDGTLIANASTNAFRIANSQTPASQTASGTQGQITWDASYLYVCTSTNNWGRSSLNWAGGGGGGGSSNIWIPASEWIPRTTNGCGINSLESTTNRVNYDVLEFDPAAVEYAQATVVMPNNWNAGTVTAKFHWTAGSSSGDVVWQLSGRAYANDDAIDQATGTAQSSTDTLTAVNDLDISPATSAITIAGTAANGNPVVFELSRNATAGGDTLGTDARLIGVEITYSV